MQKFGSCGLGASTCDTYKCLGILCPFRIKSFSSQKKQWVSKLDLVYLIVTRALLICQSVIAGVDYDKINSRQLTGVVHVRVFHILVLQVWLILLIKQYTRVKFYPRGDYGIHVYVLISTLVLTLFIDV